MKDIRLKFSKKRNMIFISHLDLLRLFQRVFRRAGIKLKYTGSFNPQPKMSFGTALSLGVESESEYMDIELEEDMDIEELKEKLNDNLPEGIEILGAIEKKEKASIMSLIAWSTYEVKTSLKEDFSNEDIENEIKNFLDLNEIVDIREKKKKNKITKREVNIRSLIKSIEVIEKKGKNLNLFMFLKTGSNGNLKPEIVLEKINEYTSLKLDIEDIIIVRKELMVEEENKIKTII